MGGKYAGEKAPGGTHEHHDCGPRERLWLPRDLRAEGSAARHPYCTHCGAVRDLALPRAKPLGYYLGGLARLKSYLEHSALHPKLAQVQSHLMTSRLGTRPEFEDAYGTPGRAQLQAYVETVRSIRPDLAEELLFRLLPGTRRGKHDAPLHEPECLA